MIEFLWTLVNGIAEKLLKGVDLKDIHKALIANGRWLICIAAVLFALCLALVLRKYVLGILTGAWSAVPSIEVADFLLIILTILMFIIGLILIFEGYKGRVHKAIVLSAVIGFVCFSSSMSWLRITHLVSKAVVGVHSDVSDRTKRQKILSWAVRTDPENIDANLEMGVMKDLTDTDVKSAIMHYNLVDNYEVRIVDKVLDWLSRAGTLKPETQSKKNEALINLARLHLYETNDKKLAKRNAQTALLKIKLNEKDDPLLSYRYNISSARVRLFDASSSSLLWDESSHDLLKTALHISQENNLDQRTRVFGYCLMMDNNAREHDPSQQSFLTKHTKCEIVRCCGAYSRSDTPEEKVWYETATSKLSVCLEQYATEFGTLCPWGGMQASQSSTEG